MFLALVVAVALAAPSGFHDAPRLAPIASFVAGKPVTVSCANTGYEWSQWVGSYGDTAAGTAVVGSDTLQLSPDACNFLFARLNRKPVTMYSAAASIETLTHEALHDRGLSDEGETDCNAARLTPVVAARFFGWTTHAQRHAVAAAVAAYRAHLPPKYRTRC